MSLRNHRYQQTSSGAVRDDRVDRILTLLNTDRPDRPRPRAAVATDEVDWTPTVLPTWLRERLGGVDCPALGWVRRCVSCDEEGHHEVATYRVGSRNRSSDQFLGDISLTTVHRIVGP